MDISDGVRTVPVLQAAPTSRSCLETLCVRTSPPLLQNCKEINSNDINKEENYEHFRIGKRNKRRLEEINEENNQTQAGKSHKSEKRLNSAP